VSGEWFGALATVAGGLVWFFYRRWKASVEWRAERVFEERRAKDDTRLTINRLEPKLDGLISENHEQSKTLAVIGSHQATHTEQLRVVTERLDEHGQRIAALESKNERSE
jgi:hypothetical protein